MKKLSILLAIVVLLAAVGIGVLVNQKNKANTELTAATAKVGETQAALDEAVKKTGEVETQLETAKTDLAAAQEELAAAVAASDTAKADFTAQLGAAQEQQAAAQQEFEAAKAELEAANAQITASYKEENAKVLGLRLMLQNATLAKDAALAKSDELLALVDTGATQQGELTATLDAALTDKAAAEAKVSELETAKAAAEAKVTELEARVAELESAKADTDAQAAELETLKADLAAKAAELETVKADLEKANARVAELTTANEEALAAAVADADAKVVALEAAKAAAEARVGELEAQLAAPAEAPAVKHGLGMVTSIGSVADATAEKPGAAQVNTTVCSLVLDAEGRIQSVTWDVQQTKVQFSVEGKPVDLPEEMLTKLEKGEAYGMVRASEIGKEWFEQIDAFAQFATGKTVEEVLSIPVFERDASHQQVPDVEELKASVTITVGDYLASLQKAAANAK